ncbi:hypothetical protein M446_6844 [Methylobacterium sp. 4-46]|uniref:hypothetical protein n=1 Tax=unclassified Methylobacterium TaxID=2615210 RepID=UPI000152D495|nr:MULTISPECIES: hypothetical protein [Methylobacterium]ACA21089.1 hypothetical protein M446_6844 [Methylobacterium sp. 4-46]WFT80238.1 hypothetical protein QA634_34560 [Methylobacterium nodulans]
MPKLTHGAVLALAALMGTAGLTTAGFTTAGLAQTPGAPLQGRDTSPLPPPNERIPEKMRPPSDTDATGSTLSDRLERSDGVLKPPTSATPDMTVKPPVPDPNSTRVIRPGDLPGNGPATEAK